MSLGDQSNTYAGVGVGASGVGSLVSILAFALPYWIYYEEDLTLNDGTGSYQVQFTYYYGFWKYCNKVLSDISNSDTCGAVDTHSDVEQTTSSLLLLAILLFVSAVVNGCLYLTAFKKEKLCLYLALVSVVVAGVLALTSLIVYAQTDHSVAVTNTITLNYTASKLHASFWLVVAGCFMVAIATIFITLAIINARRSENEAGDKKSVISYDSVDKKIQDDNDISEEYEYKDPTIPEVYPYSDPYSTSSESMSELEGACDSDDSDIDPEFAKLKTKLTPKPSGLQTSGESDTPEIRRCRSSEPLTMVSSTSKVTSSSLHRSRSAATLTPVEQNDANQDISADKTLNSLEKEIFSPKPLENVTFSPKPLENVTGNPLFRDNLHFESSKAPVATNIVFAVPRPVIDSNDGLTLRRAKTDMPFTQRMKDTLEHTKNTPQLVAETNDSVRESAEIVTEPTLPPLPFKRKDLPKKAHKSKPKLKKPSKEEQRRIKELTDVYSAPSPIKTFFPAHNSHKPAPWSAPRTRALTSKSMKWSLNAYGADFHTLSKQLKSLRKKCRASASLDDSDTAERPGEDSSVA